MKKIIKFFKKLPTWFYAAMTIIIGVGMCTVAGVMIAFYLAKDKFKKKSKTDTQVEENEKAIEEGSKIINDNRDFIDTMRAKNKRRKLH